MRLGTTILVRIIAMATLLVGTSGGVALSREWTAESIIAKIEASGLAEEINAVIGLEAASAGYGPGEDERIEIRFDGGQKLFGYDGAGGTYHLLDDGRILLIDSEGIAGVIAADFGSFIAIATGTPDWRSALRFVGAKTLDAARAEWIAFMVQWNVEAQQDQNWPYSPDLFSTLTPREARRAIAAYFGVDSLPDPFAALYKAVNTLNEDVSVSWEGEFDYPLFGRSFSAD